MQIYKINLGLHCYSTIILLLRLQTVKYFGNTHVGHYGAVALDDVRAVVTLQHHVQVHQDPLVLVFVSCATHLLVTHRQRK